MIRLKTYTSDPTTISGKSGAYSKDEWAETRKANCKYYKDKSNSSFFQYIFLNDSFKLFEAAKLVEILDFSYFKTLVDIGGVPFMQSLVIKNKFPDIELILTDYDDFSVSLHKEIDIFKSLAKDIFVFDAKSKDYSILKGRFDVITMWGVDYALEDDELISLFKFISEEGRNKEVCLVMASIHFKDIEVDIPILSKFAKIFLEKIYVAYKEIRCSIIPKIKGKKMRHHGYLRTPSYIKNLTRKANCNSKLIMRSNTYDIYEIRPN